MKFNTTISRIMFNIFAVISFIGFFIIGCVVDIGANGLINYVYLVCGWIICILLAALFYDYRIIFRHVYAWACVVLVAHGYIHKKRSRRYIALYEVAIETGDFNEFYDTMLELYDISHKRKDDV